jgi:N-acetylglucosaminyl-diphospho-decaprenol L-rhamnosyltransferase
VGGFDESFFFFVEDVDLCRRLWDAGWEVWFEPRAEVVHDWGGSWTRRPLGYLWLHHRNLLRYAAKHERGWGRLAYPAIALGLGARFAVLALRWALWGRALPRHRRLAAPRGAPDGR